MPRRKAHGRKGKGKKTSKNEKKKREPPVDPEEGHSNDENIDGKTSARKRQKSQVVVPRGPPEDCKIKSTELSEVGNNEGTKNKKPTSSQGDRNTSTTQATSTLKTGRLYEAPLEPEWENVENREFYRQGGLHPIHINDFIDEDERFEVINKLGFGFHSTVWACLDNETMRIRAVKVIRADQSTEDCAEIKVEKLLRNCTEEELAKNYIVAPLAHFWIKGPNGRHLCLVLPLVGTTINATVIQPNSLNDRLELNEMSRQISEGVRFLHSKGICHGDLTPANILHQICRDDTSIDKLEGILQILEREIRTCDIIPRSNKLSEHHAPRYLVEPVDTQELSQKFGTGRVGISDFGLSYSVADAPKKQRFPICYSSPGLMIGGLTGGAADDIWSLACTIYEIKTKKRLFDASTPKQYRIATLEWLFGALPEQYRNKAKEILALENNYNTIPEALETAIVESDPVSTVYVKDFEDFVSKCQEECRFFKDSSHPLQALLREPIWQDEEREASKQQVGCGENEGEEKPDKAETAVDHKSTQSTSEGGEAESSDGLEGHTKQSTIDPKELAHDANSVRDPDRKSMRIREQYDLIDQPSSYQEGDEYSLKSGEVSILSDLLLQMFQLNPENRISIDKVLSHKWFDEFREDQGKDLESGKV